MMKVKARIRDDRKLWDELTRSVASMKGGGHVDIGLFAEEGRQGIDLVEYASRNEFGDPDHMLHGHPAPIPERSFIRSTFDENQEEIVRQVEKAKLDLLLGKVKPDRFLKRLGQWFEWKVKHSCRQVGTKDHENPPPLWGQVLNLEFRLNSRFKT